MFCLSHSLVSAKELPLVDYPAQIEGSGNLSADDIIGVDQKWERTKGNPEMMRRARHYSNPVTMGDFAKKNPETGSLVPSWALAGSSASVNETEEEEQPGNIKETFREMLAMVVQDLENWYCSTPDPVKRHSSVTNTPSTASATTPIEQVLAEAVIGTWKERSPVQRRIRLHRSSSARSRLQTEAEAAALVGRQAGIQRHVSLGAHDYRHSTASRSNSADLTANAAPSSAIITPQSSGEVTPLVIATPINQQSWREDGESAWREEKEPSRNHLHAHLPPVLITCPSEESLHVNNAKDIEKTPTKRRSSPLAWSTLPPAAAAAATLPQVSHSPQVAEPEPGRWQNPRVRQYTVQYLRQYFERLARSNAEQLTRPKPQPVRRKLTKSFSAAAELERTANLDSTVAKSDLDMSAKAEVEHTATIVTSDSGCLSNMSNMSLSSVPDSSAVMSQVSPAKSSTAASPTDPESQTRRNHMSTTSAIEGDSEGTCSLSSRSGHTSPSSFGSMSDGLSASVLSCENLAVFPDAVTPDTSFSAERKLDLSDVVHNYDNVKETIV